MEEFRNSNASSTWVHLWNSKYSSQNVVKEEPKHDYLQSSVNRALVSVYAEIAELFDLEGLPFIVEYVNEMTTNYLFNNSGVTSLEDVKIKVSTMLHLVKSMVALKDDIQVITNNMDPDKPGIFFNYGKEQ